MQALASPDVLFAGFQVGAKSLANARMMFQSLITDLVSAVHPSATEVAGPGGSDWGIDTYVGRLDGTVFVWQSKFFPEWKGEIQRKQVRDSFNQLMTKAKEKKFTVTAWTLCVPCILPPDQQLWFDAWRKRQSSAYGVEIDFWNGTRIRSLLMKPDAEWVCQRYFDHPTLVLVPESVKMASDTSTLTDALFVRQLEEAGYVENDAARGLFFAAEALVRDLAARGNIAGVAALDDLHLEVHHIWEDRFNSLAGSAGGDGRIAGLIERVVSEAAACADPPGIRLRPAHRQGIAHRLVEDQKAGWVTHWRAVAQSHSGHIDTRAAVAAILAGGREGTQDE